MAILRHSNSCSSADFNHLKNAKLWTISAETRKICALLLFKIQKTSPLGATDVLSASSFLEAPVGVAAVFESVACPDVRYTKPYLVGLKFGVSRAAHNDQFDSTPQDIWSGTFLLSLPKDTPCKRFDHVLRTVHTDFK